MTGFEERDNEFSVVGRILEGLEAGRAIVPTMGKEINGINLMVEENAGMTIVF